MKEYNWRDEREKFRPDFQQKKEAPAVQPPPEEPRTDPRKIIAVIAGVIVIALIAVGVYFFINNNKSEGKGTGGPDSDTELIAAPPPVKDSATMLAEAAEKHKNAVGVVVVTLEISNGKKLTNEIGTAWAFAENKFATNAHVAVAIKEAAQQLKIQLASALLMNYAKGEGCNDLDALKKKVGEAKFEQLCNEAIQLAQQNTKSVSAAIFINGTHGKSYAITHYQIHPRYGEHGTALDPDVAILTIQGKHDTFFKIAKQDTLHSLKAGDPIAFLGFPMENINNVNLDNPVASMQTGNIVAVSDFQLKDSGKDGNLLIRHNLPSAGGASGSPIFNVKGEVVALHFGGSKIRITKDGPRIDPGSMINMSVRVDLLEGMGSDDRPISDMFE